MAEETKAPALEKNKSGGAGCNSASGGTYFLGFIGAAVYYVQQASTFWEGAVGVLKALVWPAFLVYELFKYIGM